MKLQCVYHVFEVAGEAVFLEERGWGGGDGWGRGQKSGWRGDSRATQVQNDLSVADSHSDVHLCTQFLHRPDGSFPVPPAGKYSQSMWHWPGLNPSHNIQITARLFWPFLWLHRICFGDIWAWSKFWIFDRNCANFAPKLPIYWVLGWKILEFAAKILEFWGQINWVWVLSSLSFLANA